ncbi:MATE family efflux transporter [Sorangium sp. So ce1128]
MTASRAAPASRERTTGSSTTVDQLRTEDVNRLMLRLAIPTIIGLSTNVLFNVLNAAFVGRLGTVAVAAVSISLPVALVVTAIGQGIGIGCGSYTARLLGAGRLRDASSTATLAFALAVAIGLAFNLVLFLSMDRVLVLYGASESVLEVARGYTRHLLPGYFFMLLCMVCGNIVRAEGKTAFSMWTMITAFVLNAVLDAVFIFGLQLGVRGAAIATTIAQGCAFLLYAVYFISGRGAVRVGLREFAPSFRILVEIVKIGLPVSLATVANSAAFSIIYSAARAYGDDCIAGIGLATRLMLVGTMPVIGFSVGARAVIGVSYGASDPRRVALGVRTMLLYTSGFALLFSLTMITFSESVLRLFTSDPGAVRIGSSTLVALNLFFPFFGAQVVTRDLFQVIGKTVPAGLLSIARDGLFLIPAALVLPRAFGVSGIISSQAVAELLTSVLAIALLVAEMRRLNPPERSRAAATAAGGAATGRPGPGGRTPSADRRAPGASP